MAEYAFLGFIWVELDLWITFILVLLLVYLTYSPYSDKLHIVLHLSQRRHNLHWIFLAGLLLNLGVL